MVCDEVQDASLYELQLLAAMASPKDSVVPGPDSLFLVGDGHQRLYTKPVSLRACGIEVRGRSARLRLNYRTTQGICAAALEVVSGVDLDLLDQEAAEGRDGGDGSYRSLRAGARPERKTFASDAEQADYIASVMAEARKENEGLLILGRTRTGLEKLQQLLAARGESVPLLGEAEVPKQSDAVVLATLYRSKGLESPRVILSSMQESPARFPGGSEREKDLWLRKERLLVYVGMTRARDFCTMTRVGSRVTP